MLQLKSFTFVLIESGKIRVLEYLTLLMKLTWKTFTNPVLSYTSHLQAVMFTTQYVSFLFEICQLPKYCESGMCSHNKVAHQGSHLADLDTLYIFTNNSKMAAFQAYNINTVNILLFLLHTLSQVLHILYRVTMAFGYLLACHVIFLVIMQIFLNKLCGVRQLYFHEKIVKASEPGEIRPSIRQ